MQTLATFPYCEIEFTKDGHPTAGDANTVEQTIARANATDLLIISHGWNNDMADARLLYQNFAEQMRLLIQAQAVTGIATRRLAILGVLWPSKRFADSELIPSGAASVTGAGADGPGETGLRADIKILNELLGDAAASKALNVAEEQIIDLESNPAARTKFAECILRLLPTSPESSEDGSVSVKANPDNLIDQLRNSGPTSGGSDGGAATLEVGGAAGFGELFNSAVEAARQLLNYTTYYVMKERAGLVGHQGVASILRAVQAKCPHIKMHLTGHSFGGRLVTATASAMPSADKSPLASMLLLQAAFSHHGLAKKFDGTRDGFFRSVVSERKVRGPIAITHTRNDRAVGLAYAIASRVARQDASAIGDAQDPYGGIGRNGAQSTPEAQSMRLDAPVHEFSPDGVYNLLADAVIKDHSNVCHPATAWVQLELITS
jgi:thioesterase domain-containing protein